MGREPRTTDRSAACAVPLPVIAQDESPGDNSSHAEITLDVEPYFYQTRLFYALMLAAGRARAWRECPCIVERRRAGSVQFAAVRRDARGSRVKCMTRWCRVREGVSALLEAAVGSSRSDQDQMLEWLDNARIHLRLTLDEARQALTDLRYDSFENGLPARSRSWCNR